MLATKTTAAHKGTWMGAVPEPAICLQKTAQAVQLKPALTATVTPREQSQFSAAHQILADSTLIGLPAGRWVGSKPAGRWVGSRRQHLGWHTAAAPDSIMQDSAIRIRIMCHVHWCLVLPHSNLSSLTQSQH